MNIPDRFIFGLTSTEYRPCYVVIPHGRNVTREKALFHKWTTEAHLVGAGISRGSHPAGQLSKTLGIVETEEGRVLFVEPQQIEFIDTRELMVQIAWDEEEAKQ